MTRAARQAQRLAERSDDLLAVSENMKAELDAELAQLANLELDDTDYFKPKQTYAPRPCMKCERTFTPTYRHNTVCPECQRSDAWRLGNDGHHDTRLDGGRR